METRTLVNWLSVILIISVNAMAVILPLNGKSTGALSDQFPIYITPAGYVFSIWGVIYTFLLVFCIFQSVYPSKSDSNSNSNSEIDIGWLLFPNAVLNVSWIFAWHYQTPKTLWLSLVIMILLLVSLIAIYRRITKSTATPPSTLQYIAIVFPFTIYLAWISVATFVNAFAVFGIYYHTPDGRGMESQTVPEALSICVMILLVALAACFASPLLNKRGPGKAIPSLVYLHALIGINVRQSQSNGPESIRLVSLICAISTALIAASLLFLAVRKYLTKDADTAEPESEQVLTPKDQ